MHGRADTGTRLAALALAWIAGVALHLQQRTLWPVEGYGLALGVGVLGLIAAWRWRRAFVLGLVGALLLALAASGLRASARLAHGLADALEGRDLVVTGVVASLPQRSAAGLRFRFEPDAAALDGQAVRVPQVLAVGWYKGQHEDAALTQPQSELRAGQRWRFTLRLRQPHGNLNPFGFDYELQLFEQGVRATAYVRDAPAPELLQRAAGFPVERLRQRVRDAIDASVADRRAAGVLAALSVGDQGAIEREDWDLYRNTGVAHLVSISGLHITMFAWLAGGLILRLWRRSRRAALWLPAPLAARWGGLVCATAYAVFSGWGVPSQRTIWMLAVVTLAQTLGLRWPWLLVLLLAGVVVTAIDPWALMQAGFWLSF
ncbi:MAG: ComEC/Rec2 family competence protein, partial [Burkholderiales bacterium]